MPFPSDLNLRPAVAICFYPSDSNTGYKNLYAFTQFVRTLRRQNLRMNRR